MDIRLLKVLQCPFCGGELVEKDGEIICSKEKHKFSETGILNLCNSELLQSKEKIINFFTEIDEALGETVYSRFVTFQNWGYAGEKQEAAIEISKANANYNAMQLLAELIGQENFNEKAVMDIGCGRGGTIQLINKYFQPAFIVGVDITAPSLAFCIKHVKKAAFMMADAENLPFKANCFDYLINIESASDYPDIYSFFQHVYRILKQDGKLLWADILDADQIVIYEKYLTDLGFAMERCRDVTPNVLESIKQNEKSYTATYDATDIIHTEAFRDTMGLPDTEIFGEMKAKTKKYMLYTLRKTTCI